jgi:uncharacterized repeat protein (TIGR02543 family)
MSSLQPTPIIASVPDITSALPTSVMLNGSGSIPSEGPPAGSSISEWQWILESKPPGSAAYIENDTTATPTLANIDVVGSYLVSLRVIDDLGRASHPGINPIQSNSPPYDFKFPATTSMISVRVPTASGLVKLAYGERRWLERGLWQLVDRLEQNHSDISDLQDSVAAGVPVASADTIKANNIDEFTAGNDIRARHPVRLDTLKGLTNPSLINIQAGIDVNGRMRSTTVVASSSVTSPTGSFSSSVTAPNVFTQNVAGGTGQQLLIVSGADTKLLADTAVTVEASEFSVAASDDITLTCDNSVNLVGGNSDQVKLAAGSLDLGAQSSNSQARIKGQVSSFNTLIPNTAPGSILTLASTAKTQISLTDVGHAGFGERYIGIPVLRRIGAGLRDAVTEVVIDGACASFGTSGSAVNAKFDIELSGTGVTPVVISTLRAYSNQLSSAGYLPFQIKLRLRTFSSLDSGYLSASSDLSFTTLAPSNQAKVIATDMHFVEPFNLPSGLGLDDLATISLYVTSIVGAKFKILSTSVHTIIPESQYLQVTFNSQGGSSVSSRRVAFGLTYGAYADLVTPTRSGFTFAGWYTTASGEGTRIFSTTVVSTTGSQTLYARWSS